MWSASKLHPAINQAREYDSVVVVIDDLTEMWRDVVANFHPRNRIEEQRVCLRISHALSLFIKFTYISFSKTKSSIRFLIFSLRISSAFELLEDFDTRFFFTGVDVAWCEKWRRENEEGFRIKKWMIDTFTFLIFPLIGFIFTVFVFERIFGEIIIFGINK